MLKSTYFCGGSILAVVLGLGISTTAAAQAPSEVEEVIVTGSFIAGTPEDAALPVDVVNAQEIERRGSPSMVQLIKTIPSSGAVIGENNRFGAGNGTATINLRNLNSAATGARTLVLFNGRRVAFTTRSLGSVDVNSFPTAAIARVEVLKSGAAATYGSDAIGGVVNFITRKNFDGLELNANYQFIRGSDGDYDLSAVWGHANDRGSVLLMAGHRARSQLSVFERDWAIRTGPEGYLQNPLGGWAGTGNPGLYNTSPTAPVGSPNTGFSSASFTGNLMDIGCAVNGGAPYALTTATVSPTACNFQYTVFDNLVENENHYTLYGEVNYEFTDDIEFHAEALWNRNQTPLQHWALTGPNQYPAPILASGASPGGGVSPYPATGTSEQSRFYIPNTNPGLVALVQQINAASCTSGPLPYGVDAASCATGLAAARAQVANAALHGVTASQTAWRPVGFAGAAHEDDRHSHYTYNTDTWRAVGGFRGKIWRDIGFDASLAYQEIDYRYNLEDTSVNRLQLGLRGYGSRDGHADQCTAAETNNFTTNAGNASLGCFYFNPFANAMEQSLSAVPANPFYIGSSAVPGFNEAQANRAALLDWMVEKQYQTNTTKLFVADLIFNGDTGWRLWGEDSIAWAAGAQYRWDRYIENPDPLYDTEATPCVDSPPFGDGVPPCPTTGTGPFLFNANNSPSDVSRQITSLFAEVRVPVTDDLEVTLAGRYEDYQGLGSTSNPKLSARWQVNEWLALRGSVGSTYRAPLATITQATFDRGLTNASGTYRANDLYGNPNLKPETADTLDAGVILTIGRFNATLDYWQFDFKDQLTSEATADLLALAMPTTGGCGPAALLARLTLTSPCDPAATAAVNRARILSYRTQYINGGGIKTSGLDFQANLDIGEALWGNLQAGFDGTWLLEYKEAPYTIEGVPSNAAGVIDRVGTFRASIFTGYHQLRANAYVNWSRDVHNLRWQVRHISSTRQSEATALSLALNVRSTSKIDEYWQHDLTYTGQLPWDVTLTLGVQNIFDAEPPFAIGTQYNYDPGSGNPLGRVFVAGVKKRF
ncbi:TonB-dependent receptor domain-containing protein [Phenylobacterium sp.]|jgi:iron complex outermembrane receptor protein|uniref:TonB-dependent receptor domain-containing protein n=1 Tax=Phenylobacterium sp. TaxID=1871053 RepID=UPI002F9411E2